MEGHLTWSGPFSLPLTLLCGQCFRWVGPDANGWFEGVVGQALWKVRQMGNHLQWKCNISLVRGESPGDWLCRYLNLDDGFHESLKEIASLPEMVQPFLALKGLRLLRQEPWECAVSYMFAQGLSVEVIRHALDRFCSKFGKPLSGDRGYKAFPESRDLAHLSPDVLKPFTNNYRARADRIIRLARAVHNRSVDLENMKNLPCDEARKILMTFDGIGPKIADCILLFSMEQLSAFPVDRWVLRAMKRFFPSLRFDKPEKETLTPSQYAKIVEKARFYFGNHCGLAGEYLFLFFRMQKDKKLREELAPFCGFLVQSI